MSSSLPPAQGEDEDGEEAGLPPLPPGTPNYITPAGHARLKAEALHLLDRERPELVRTVAWAASNGDRSENADYIYGKRRLREIDRRIRFLTRRLDLAEVVDPAARERTDRVYFGASVTLEGPSGKALQYRIVGIDEADVSRGRLSWIAPLARALLGHRVGDEVRVPAPGQAMSYTIVDVEYLAID